MEKTKSNLPKDENGNIKAGPGRPKGAKNKTPQMLQELFLAIAFELDEKDKLTWFDWAKQNRTEFARILARMLPKAVDVSGKIDADLIINHINYGDKPGTDDTP
ncbi:MAG: hypothetical protein ACYS1A_20410 [Planctomycetota bacterium]|jgi:hypothetical protein